MVFPLEFQPKSYDRAHDDDQWAITEKDILRKLLKTHLDKKEAEYRKKLQAYDKELALFIRNNYGTLCDLRAKYIILLSTLRMDERKRRALRELTRLLRQAGLLDLLSQDVFPEKHAILEEALKLPMCPLHPVP